MNKKKSVIYQIYPKSFKDSDGDGYGDLRGIIEKLAYLQTLGVDMLWLNPFYPSPQYDNGYDVADYCDIDPLYGTMADFEELLEEADKRGIGLMLDMVFNHCSTSHEWFQRALAGEKKYQDFFYLRPLRSDGTLPTNWESKFGGPAWERFGASDLYYLHLYDVHQADLNWHNLDVRKALYDVVNFWLAKGVKGFRFDVLNVIGKEFPLENSQKPGSAAEKALYTDTPLVHEWIHEMQEATYGRYEGILTVGEMSSTNIDNGILYTQEERGELSMIFNFHHLKVDYAEGEKWSLKPFDFVDLKDILSSWQRSMSDSKGWLALFWNNHDQPRANSRFGDPIAYPYETSTMLAQTIHLLRGTPYIYQGEEIGMTNPSYEDIDQYQDVETHNNYRLLLERGVLEEEALKIIQERSRDNSRTPMQWNEEVAGGFTKGHPWLDVNANYERVNVQREIEGGRIFHYYQRLIQLRKELPLISEGDFREVLKDHKEVFAYVREYAGETLLVMSHFYAGDVSFHLPAEFLERPYEKLIGNGPLEQLSEAVSLTSYETAAFLFK